MMKIYICHYQPLSERKDYIKDMFEKMKLDFEFITSYDKENIGEYLKDYKLNVKKWNKQLSIIMPILLKDNCKNKRNLLKTLRVKLNNFYKRYFAIPEEFQPRVINPAEISITLKHFYALGEIKKNNKPALVLEDDVIAKPNSYELIQQAFELCSDSYDYIDLGGGCDLHPLKKELPIKNYNNFASLSLPRTRTTAGYMISSDAACKLYEGIIPFIMPIDWQYNYLFKINNFKVAWSDPPAFIHGSQDIYYQSSIQ